jgi:hypothetical protein
MTNRFASGTSEIPSIQSGIVTVQPTGQPGNVTIIFPVAFETIPNLVATVACQAYPLSSFTVNIVSVEADKATVNVMYFTGGSVWSYVNFSDVYLYWTATTNPYEYLSDGYATVQSGSMVLVNNYVQANNAFINYDFGEGRIPHIIASIYSPDNPGTNFYINITEKTSSYAQFSITRFYGGTKCDYNDLSNVYLNWIATIN